MAGGSCQLELSITSNLVCPKMDPNQIKVLLARIEHIDFQDIMFLASSAQLSGDWGFLALYQNYLTGAILWSFQNFSTWNICPFSTTAWVAKSPLNWGNWRRLGWDGQFEILKRGTERCCFSSFKGICSSVTIGHNLKQGSKLLEQTLRNTTGAMRNNHCLQVMCINISR